MGRRWDTVAVASLYGGCHTVCQFPSPTTHMSLTQFTHPSLLFNENGASWANNSCYLMIVLVAEVILSLEPLHSSLFAHP